MERLIKEKSILLRTILLVLLCTMLLLPVCRAAAEESEDVRVDITSSVTELVESGPVELTVVISNYSEYEISGIELYAEDSKATVKGLDEAVIAPGGSMTFPVTYTVPESKIGLDTTFKVLYVKYGETYEINTLVHIDRASDPVIAMTREVTSDYVKSGETVVITYELSNDTKFDMTNITLYDSEVCSQPILRNHTLNAGGTVSQSYVLTMGSEDVISAPIVTYEVNGKTKTFSAVDSVTIKHVVIELTMTVEQGEAAAEGVPFTITVVNTGNTDIQNITVTDERGNKVNSKPFNLSAGSEKALSYTVVPSMDEQLRQVSFIMTGVDAYGDACEFKDDATYPVIPYIEDSQINVLVASEILTDWTQESGTVTVRITITNLSEVALTNAVLSETTLGTLESYQVLPGGETVFEGTLSLSSPRNLTFLLTAQDPAGTERQVGTASLTVTAPIATAEPTAEPEATPEPEKTAEPKLLSGGWQGMLLIIVGAVILLVILAIIALITLTVLEHKRTGGINLDIEEEDDDDIPDDSIDFIDEEIPQKKEDTDSRSAAGKRSVRNTAAQETGTGKEQRRSNPQTGTAERGNVSYYVDRANARATYHTRHMDTYGADAGEGDTVVMPSAARTANRPAESASYKTEADRTQRASRDAAETTEVKVAPSVIVLPANVSAEPVKEELHRTPVEAAKTDAAMEEDSMTAEREPGRVNTVSAAAQSCVSVADDGLSNGSEAVYGIGAVSGQDSASGAETTEAVPAKAAGSMSRQTDAASEIDAEPAAPAAEVPAKPKTARTIPSFLTAQKETMTPCATSYWELDTAKTQVNARSIHVKDDPAVRPLISEKPRRINKAAANGGEDHE